MTRGPFGNRYRLQLLLLCFLLAVGVAEARYVPLEIRDSKFNQLEQGMTKEEEIELVGNPSHTQQDPEHRAEHLVYIQRAWGKWDGTVWKTDYVGAITITMKEGRLGSKGIEEYVLYEGHHR